MVFCTSLGTASSSRFLVSSVITQHVLGHFKAAAVSWPSVFVRRTSVRWSATLQRPAAATVQQNTDSSRTLYQPVLLAAEAPTIVLVGFSADECEQLESLLEQDEPASICPATDAVMLATLSNTCTLLPARSADQASTSGRASDAELGRTALLVGDSPTFPHALQAALRQAELQPAIYAAVQPQHLGWSIRDILRSIRNAHAKHHAIIQPLRTQAGVALPEAARVTMSICLDASGAALDQRSEHRDDCSHVVVLDDMFSEAERCQVLDWLTAPGWDHSQGPPEARWERSCVDREGDSVTWGVRPEVLAALQHEPPPSLVAIQSRLADLYPHFHICYMPAAAMQDEDEVEGGLSPFVGNAVLHGEEYSWHIDADPAQVDVESPWARHFGLYYNREAGKPLFVSMLMYLDADWPEHFNAETMFLDPDTDAGVFVRPRAGRLVLMDQDVPHRISAPSLAAGRARYSLVWKLVFVPKVASLFEEQTPTLSLRHRGASLQPFGSATGPPASLKLRSAA